MKRMKRTLIVTSLLVCLLSFSSLETCHALLSSSTAPLVNEFTYEDPEEPDIKIVEDLTNGKKVQIINTGNKNVRVRVYLSVYYQSDTDPNSILPANGFTYDKGDTTHWIWNGNSATWTEVLQPGALTGVLINDVTAPAAPEGYHLEVKVIAQNIPV